MSMKLLLIEDDIKLAESLKECLRGHDFEMTHVADGASLRIMITQNMEFNVIIMDRLLGSMDTKHELLNIRRKWPQASIIVLSAICMPQERIELLNLGVDDYLGKPFSTAELVARIRAMMRRTFPSQNSALKVGNLSIDQVKRIVTVGAQTSTLTAKEFMLLRSFCQEPGRVWSRQDLLNTVWENSTEIETNVVEATVANLRKRLSDLGAAVHIKNMRNVGYWIEA